MTESSSDDEGFSVRGQGPIQAAQDLTAAIYARTSSSQQRHGYSIDEQVRQCWDRCNEYDWTVSHVFRDKEVSGKDTDREMFQKLLDGAEAGWFDVVLVWKLDRFSRSLMHAVQIEKKLRQWNVGLHSITEQLDTTTPTGRFNFRSISSASELERDLIKQRSQMGMQALAEEGKWPNRDPPIGYDIQNNGRLAVNEDEAELVSHIFNQYIDLRSMPELAEKLNHYPDFADRGIDWTPYSVGKILKNRLYLGEYSMANIETHIEEYQIIGRDLFEEATDIRTRFQQDDKTSRPKMPDSRKQNNIDNIIEQYYGFLENTGIE